MISEKFEPGKNFVVLVDLGMIMVVEGKVGAFKTLKLNQLNVVSLLVVYFTLVIELVFF